MIITHIIIFSESLFDLNHNSDLIDSFKTELNKRGIQFTLKNISDDDF